LQRLITPFLGVFAQAFSKKACDQNIFWKGLQGSGENT
jgi:hypothetical protein